MRLYATNRDGTARVLEVGSFEEVKTKLRPGETLVGWVISDAETPVVCNFCPTCGHVHGGKAWLVPTDRTAQTEVARLRGLLALMQEQIGEDLRTKEA